PAVVGIAFKEIEVNTHCGGEDDGSLRRVPLHGAVVDLESVGVAEEFAESAAPFLGDLRSFLPCRIENFEGPDAKNSRVDPGKRLTGGVPQIVAFGEEGETPMSAAEFTAIRQINFHIRKEEKEFAAKL